MTRPPSRKATSQDVADLAGVSRSAVSLVLNGRGDGNIAPDKQAAIRAAAAQLEYEPNPSAVSLRSSRTRTLGMVTDAIASTAYGGDLLRGASEAAERSGHLLVLVDTHDEEQREADAYRTLRGRRVDGLLFAAMSLREYSVPAAATGVPFALANCYDPAAPSVPAFVADEVAGGRAAARLLLDAGHRDVVLLAGARDAVASTLREDGVRAELTAAGHALRTVETGWEISDGVAAATAVLTGPDRPTGLVCANDRVAVGAVLAANRLGLDVPADLSVVGYDDDAALAAPMVPALTTIALPHRQIGEAAVARVLADLAVDVSGTGEPRTTGHGTVLVPCPVVVRDSVAPPRRRTSRQRAGSPNR
ncbi:LacI family DNA-binding transcriptional regulator [Kineococcus sp. DHX-1]|uniref:LacI family DNA-binding transcriptional regulator n=1 Tax=Kineococcus sp. DHX-1 TaxID=3349638 RepID=UPI0036D3B64A